VQFFKYHAIYELCQNFASVKIHYFGKFYACSGAVAVGLYGNDDVHNGLVQVLASVASINEVFLSARNEVSSQYRIFFILNFSF